MKTHRWHRIGILAAALALPGTPSAAADLMPGPDGTITLERAHGAAAVQSLSLGQGKSVVIRTGYPVKRVSVGNPEIADVVVLGNREIQLVAKATGETNVVFWDAQGAAQQAIDLYVGRPHGAIEGQLRSILGSDDVRVEGAGDSIVLQGSVATVDAVERATRLARAYFPGKGEEGVINLLEVGGNQQVMIEVTIAEMSRTFGREMQSNFAIIGDDDGSTFRVFNFLDNLTSLQDDAFGADALLLTSGVNLAAGYANLGDTAYNLFLNYLQEKGLVKILAEPTLVARSGQSASFLAGGEVPIPIAQGGAFGSITIEFKEFGVGVKFTPTVLGEDRIHLEVTPEVSEPDFTIGTTVEGTTVPGFTTRRASTGIELADGQSFAIAGLLREEVRELASQYPLLGDIPVLGNLFRSKRFQKAETELVLLVRPRLVKPLPPGPHPLPTDHFIEPSDWEFYLTNRLEGETPEEAPVATDPAVSGGLLGGAGHRVSVADAEKELR